MAESSHRPECEIWTSVQYGAFLEALARSLSDRGFIARQRFSVPEHIYRSANGALARTALRLRCYAGYPIQIAVRMRCQSPPKVAIVSSNTFYAPLVARAFSEGRGVPVINWVLDLFPDALIASGAIREDSLLDHAIRGTMRTILHHADANVFLGRRLLEAAERRLGCVPRSTVIPVGCDASLFSGATEPDLSHSSPLRLLYCGNLGRLHDIDTIIATLRTGNPTQAQWKFLGNGSGFVALKRELADGPSCGWLEFGSNLPESAWIDEMRRSQIALVTIRAGAESVVMPSKTYSAMSAGQAIMAICPGSSDLAELVVRHDCGWVIQPGDSAALTGLLSRLRRSPEEVRQKRTNALDSARRYYDSGVIARDWCRLISEVSDPGCHQTAI